MASTVPQRPLRSFPVADFTDLAAIRRHHPVIVLIVRRDSEWAQPRIDGAIHVPLHELPARLVLLEPYAWVHGDGMVDSHNYVLS